MPIRMEKDDPQGPQRPSNDPRRNTGGSNPLGKLLPFILLFLFKKPKLLIPILAIGAVWYFFLGGQEMLSGGIDQSSAEAGDFFFGATLDEEHYDQAEVFEPVSYGASYSAGSLPPSVSLLRYAPTRQHQGRQGSCVGWASSYGARSILQARATGKAPDQVAFSPAYLYNQIALPGCQGAYMLDAMETMRTGGVLPFSQYPYDERSCSNKPDSREQQAAQQFRIKGYNRLTLGANNYTPDLEGIKQHLAQGAPVVIGMQVGGTFMHAMQGQAAWRPTQRDRSLYGFSGHAMCVIGYDDNREGGAFQIMNSWGRGWGDDGIAWVNYSDFKFFVKEAYGLYPMGEAEKFDPNKLAVKFGLVDNATQSLLPLQAAGERVFRTSRPISKGDKFKVAVTNSIECYIYVFGEETDGSSYVLFPYTPKHSPYCGITGTRLFPKDYSMTADEIGNRDRIAIVVSKELLDYNTLNERINQSRQSTYAGKLREALRAVEIADVKFAAGDAVEFLCDTKGRSAVGMVLEIDKR